MYSIGLLEEYGEVRTLKVARIKELQRIDKTFEKPATFSLAAYTHGTFGVFRPGKLEKIRVRFSGWGATNVREQQWHHSQKIVKDDGETLTVEFELSNTVEFKRWLLGFGRHAVVLKPKSLAADIAEELRRGIGNYE